MDKDRELLKLKIHYLLFFAGLAPMLLFTSTYAKQLGFSAFTVGSILTLMPIIGMIGKLVIGALSDKLQAHKQIALVLLTMSIASYYSMMYIPPIENDELLSEIHCESSTKQLSLELCNPSRHEEEEENGCDAEASNSNYAPSQTACQMQCLLDQDFLASECQKAKTTFVSNRLVKLCERSQKRTDDALMNLTSNSDELTIVDHETIHLEINITTNPVKKMVTNDTGVCSSFDIVSMYYPVQRQLYSYADLLSNNRICERGDAVKLASCKMVCDNPHLADIGTLVEKKPRPVTQEYQLWVFILLLVLGGLGAAVINSISDTMCFALLGESSSEFGKTRLWGSVGWGIFALVSGKIIDEFSKGKFVKNYSPAFISTAIFLSLDALVVLSLNTVVKKKTKSIALDVGKVLMNIESIIFLCWCISVGACLGLVFGFLFWYIEDLSRCANKASIKPLEGLYVILQTFGGELPFFFLNAWLCKKLGLVNCMSLVLFLYGVIFCTMSLLSNPWHFLPLAMINGMAFSTLYSVMTSYANSLALPGTETTMQSLVGSAYDGLGVSSGNFLAGLLMNNMKGEMVFRIFGIAMLVLCAIHCILHCVLHYLSKKSRKSVKLANEKGSTHPTVEYSKAAEVTTK
ncbi:hypothetical protein LSTR_LSTR000487 [Laodelphax striatellus]|uniref:Major facilitator superfamily associated domain-containing protein n=1 Tax=Laodelphax striatellus TaxID=195883 RepID=A0A482X1W8_LAOST|nr:hypothetical protein LSTR_LSTR000487 [Laodelphax striatellus]